MISKLPQIPLFWILLNWSLFPASGQEEILSVLHEPATHKNYSTWFSWSGGPLMLVKHLNRLSIECIENREAEISQLRSAQDWRARQEKTREFDPRKHVNETESAEGAKRTLEFAQNVYAAQKADRNLRIAIGGPSLTELVLWSAK